MRTTLLSLTAGAALLGSLAAAEAMPGGLSVPDAAGGEIILASGGCGLGALRNVYGYCRPNFRGRGRYFYRRHYGSQRYFYRNF